MFPWLTLAGGQQHQQHLVRHQGDAHIPLPSGRANRSSVCLMAIHRPRQVFLGLGTDGDSTNKRHRRSAATASHDRLIGPSC